MIRRAPAYTVLLFTIRNLTNRPLDYALSADLFTQDVFANGETLYMDTWTKSLSASTSFIADGLPVVPAADLAAFDLNGDGQVNEADANTLLEYLLGNALSFTAPAMSMAMAR